MSKFICNYCLRGFDAPLTSNVYEKRDNLRGYASRVESACPYCGSDDIESGCGTCPVCGDTTRQTEKLCDPCKREFSAKLRAFMSRLTAGEVEYLDEISEGNSFEDYERWGLSGT